MLGLLNQLRIVGELWTAGASHVGDSFSLSLGRRGATGFPLLTTWDPVAGLGRAPIPENISGRKLTQVLNSVGSVLVQQETADWGGMKPRQLWILGQGLRVGGPGTPPFWRTRNEFCGDLKENWFLLFSN